MAIAAAAIVLAGCGSAGGGGARTLTVVHTTPGPLAAAQGIVYFSAGPENGAHALYSVAPDGAGLTQARAAGQLSPGGGLAVALTRAGGRTAIAVQPLAGGRRVLLPAPAATVGLGPLSPGGSRLATEGRTGISVVATAGGAAARVTRTATHDYPLAWSPDGTHLLFARNVTGHDPDGPVNLFVVNADGAGLVQINPAGTVSQMMQPIPMAAWSPDSRRVVFVAADGSTFWDGGAHVWVAGADGSRPRPLLGTSGALFPSWSPNDRWIAYDQGPHHELYVIHPDGTGERQLTDGGTGPFSIAAVWSPDSTRLLFLRGQGDDVFGHDDLWTVGADGTGLTRVTQRPEEYAGYTWLAGPA
jgi:Tol biopolymer transport system component